MTGCRIIGSMLCALLLLLSADADTIVYTYDAAGRVIGADYGGGKTIAWTYDRRGNMTSRLMTGANPSPRADVGVVKMDDVDPVSAGSNLTYTITAWNNGPDAATGVVVGDALPPFLPLQGVAFSQGNIIVSSSNVMWNVGMLASNATATLELMVRPLRAGTITNTVVIAAGETDSVPENNGMSITTVVHPAADRDGDGMPDWWELLYYADPTNAVAGADDDGDTLSNLFEYYADTHPLDRASVLRITQALPNADTLTLQFDTSPVRLYDIQFKSDLMSAIWSNLVENLPGNGDTMTVIAPADVTRGYYRAKAKGH